MALLLGTRNDGATVEHAYLDSAVAAQLRDMTFEPLLEIESFWNAFLYPEVQDGKMTLQVERIVHLQDLAAAFPNTQFGRAWMQRSTGYARLNRRNIEQIVHAFGSTYDVDLLSALAYRLMEKDFPIYDLTLADKFATRAEVSSLKQTSFRTGENIFGSMGRVDRIRSMRVKIRTLQGKPDEAIALGLDAMRHAVDQYGREIISKALEEAALSKGDSLQAKKFMEYELPVIADFEYISIDGTAGRLSDHKGKVVVIDSWFLGCAGCALEHKSLNEFGNKYASNPHVVFLSLALNDQRTLEHYLSRSPLKATVVAEAQAICDKLGVTAFPTHIIIDQTGKTVLWQVGGSSSSGEKLGLEVEKLLK
ncbi:MAG: TlpA disulfide reductase family protein [bacterium]|nr:TlpA disulfide reductase family protein [bacterium]